MASLNPNADPFLSEGRYLQPEDGDGEDGRRRRVFHGASVVDARRPLDESNDRRRRFFFYIEEAIRGSRRAANRATIKVKTGRAHPRSSTVAWAKVRLWSFQL